MGYQDQGAGRQMLMFHLWEYNAQAVAPKSMNFRLNPKAIVLFIAAIVIDRAIQTDRSATISDKIKILADRDKPLMFLR